MARLPYLCAYDLEPGDRDLLAHRDLLGRAISISRLLAHSPDVLRAWADMGSTIRQARDLDGRLREMAIIAVGAAAANRYVFAHHVEIGLRFGVSADDVSMVLAWLANANPECTELEAAVLSAVRELTGTGGLDDGTWRALASELTPAGCVELVATIAYYNMTVRVAAALGVELEPEYREFLPPDDPDRI